MPKPLNAKCTVTTMLVKYPHGEQAQDDSTAALTLIRLDKADTEPDAREIAFFALASGDLRADFHEGDTVTLTVQPPAAGATAETRPAKLEGIAAARAEAGYLQAAAVVVTPKEQAQPGAPKPSESTKEPPKKSY